MGFIFESWGLSESGLNLVTFSLLSFLRDHARNISKVLYFNGW